MTQVSTGQVTAPQTAAPALEALPAGAQLRGQVASGAPEGMMRLVVGSARLDVKADLPLPAGTPVLIEVEQPAPVMRLKVSADEAALQGRGQPQANAGQSSGAGASPATGLAPGQATSDASLQAQQLKSAAALAQAAGGTTPAQAPLQTGTAQARPVLANVDLSTFVLLKADTKAPAAASGPIPAASASGSPASGSPVSSAAATGSAAAPGAPAGGQSAASAPAGAQATVQAAPQAGAQAPVPTVADAAGRGQPTAQAPVAGAAPSGTAPSAPSPGQAAGTAAAGSPAQVPAAGTMPAPSGSAGQGQISGQILGQTLGQTVGQPVGPGTNQAATPGANPVPGQPQGQAAGPQSSGQPSAPSLPSSPPSAAAVAGSTGMGAEGVGAAKPAVPSAAGLSAGAAVPSGAAPGQAATASASGIGAGPQMAPGLGQSAAANAGTAASNAAATGAPAQTAGPAASPAAAGSASGINRQMPAPASSADASAVTPSRASLSGAQTEAELQALARGPGPLTAAGEAARALDPQALKAALAESAQARTVLSALMASAGKLDTAALPPAGQKLVEALKGLQADADSLSDPARLKAAVDAVLGLAASATGAMAAGLQRKGDVPQKADGLTMLLVRLAGLADEALAAQPQLPSGRKGAAQAGRGGMPSSLDPDTATALAQKTGAEVGERVRLQSVSRMAAEYLIRDMARAAGKGTAQEAQAGQARAASGAAAGGAPAGTSSGAPAARPVDVSLDLPVLIDGQSRVLSLRISRDPQNPDVPADPKGPEWRVRFSLDLPEGGLVEAAAGLRGTSSYVTLRAAEDETLAGFLSRRETLAALFADEGLDLEDLRILRAKPETVPAIAPLPLDRSS